jgi:general secretion pathway protein C
MELFLKRNFWIVPALVVIIAAALLARITLHLVEGAYLLDEGKRPPKALKASAVKPADTKAPAAGKDADAVAARDIFCSTCAPAALPTTMASGGGDAVGGQVPATTLPLALVGTFVSVDPRVSAATVVNTQLNRSGIFGVDEDIPGAGAIVAIAPRWVDFKNPAANRVERLDLLGVPKPGKEPPKVADAKPENKPASPEGDLAAELDQGVKKIDDTHFQIDRAVLDKVLADPNLVARGARIVPSVVNGKANGFKVYAIRPNSAYAKIGLQNGDTLHSINGYEMTSPDKALEVYTKLKSASSLTVTMTRRGEQTTMNYVIK